jgi:hypothetical protein
MTSVPLFWLRWLKGLFFVEDEKFACKLWSELDATPTLLFQISICDHSEASIELWRARMRHLRGILHPQALLDASLRVAPETGRPRMPSAIHFEDELLSLLDRDGGWR